MPDERSSSAIAFLEAALAWFASLGVNVERVMTDNGSCYKSFAFRKACRALGLKHIRTRPYTPRTNGKAERFIQTSSARMGLCPGLRHLTIDAPPSCLMAAPLQLAQASWRHRSSAHQPTRPDREQPVEAPQTPSFATLFLPVTST